jgi:hypothetical protein
LLALPWFGPAWADVAVSFELRPDPNPVSIGESARFTLFGKSDLGFAGLTIPANGGGLAFAGLTFSSVTGANNVQVSLFPEAANPLEALVIAVLCSITCPRGDSIELATFEFRLTAPEGTVTLAGTFEDTFVDDSLEPAGYVTVGRDFFASSGIRSQSTGTGIPLPGSAALLAMGAATMLLAGRTRRAATRAPRGPDVPTAR